jgi:putative methyltransferase (TIGR04325 family)
MSSLRKKIKQLFRGARRGGITVTGDYRSWEEAARDSGGYDSAVILEKTCAALLKVKNGEAVYERDSVLFDKIAHPFPVLAGLLRAAQADNGRLCVVDFGGALGSSYFQCRAFLSVVTKLEWLVVEQAAHVARGRKIFASDQLNFFETVDECVVAHQPNALLLSSVLPYLPKPYEVLAELLGYGFSHVIVDRTGLLESDRERLTVQRVPDSIYPASYPSWFFGETAFLKAFEKAGYRLLADFPGTDRISPEDEKANFKGFIFEKSSR